VPQSTQFVLDLEAYADDLEIKTRKDKTPSGVFELKLYVSDAATDEEDVMLDSVNLGGIPYKHSDSPHALVALSLVTP
jgi:hypothetical protein